MTSFGRVWAEEVCASCDPVFAAAGVGFERQVHPASEGDGPVESLLWEADPALFAAAYPDSGIVESYGAEQWPGVGCIDFWVYVEATRGRCRLSVEGWSLPEMWVTATGHGGLDGMVLATVFARVLAVQWPPREADAGHADVVPPEGGRSPRERAT